MDLATASFPWSILNNAVSWFGKRPIFKLEPTGEGEAQDLLPFSLHMINNTPNSVHIYKHKFRGSSSSLSASEGSLADVLRQTMTGAINLWIDAGDSQTLKLKIEKNRPLSLWLSWRPTAGWWYPSTLVPLNVVMSANLVSRLQYAQKRRPFFGVA
jgi:hypothetical protein